MKQKFIIGIDQSTQGTKAILFDEKGNLLHRTDRSHAQLIDERGWVEHDPEEIYRNTLLVVEELLGKSGVDREAVACVGITHHAVDRHLGRQAIGIPNIPHSVSSHFKSRI